MIKTIFYHLGLSGWKGCYLVTPGYEKIYNRGVFEKKVLLRNGNKENYHFRWHKSLLEIRMAMLSGQVPVFESGYFAGWVCMYMRGIT